MAASIGAVASPLEELYFDAAFTTKAPTWAQLTATSGGIIVSTKKVQDVTEIAAAETSGNPIEYTPAGSGTTKSVPGAASLGEFSFTVAVDNSNTIHSSLAGYEAGDPAAVVVLTKTATTAQTATYLLGSISAVSKAWATGGDYQRLTVSMALSQKPIDVDQS